MYGIGEKVVYPGHGVATIIRIIERKVGSKTISFYELKFVNKGMTVLIPTENAIAIGIRPLSSYQEVEGIIKNLSLPAKKLKNDYGIASNWNRRYKEYQHRLRTGNLSEISEIYRELKDISLQKELSFGEKTLLQQTELLLAEEISAVQKLEEDKAVEYLRTLCHSNYKMGSQNPQL